VIVRINQLETSRAEEEAHWASQGILGPIQYTWPAGWQVFEVLILEQDERQQELNEEFRQSQLRLVLPQTIAALREQGEEIVIRLDGPVAEGELLAAYRHLTESDQSGRFAVSEVQKLDAAPMDVIGSVRIQPSPQGCAAICHDKELGLHRSVRLRAFSIAEQWVTPLLDITRTDDERWGEILPHAGFVLSTSRGLRSLQVTSQRLAPQELKTRLLQRLLAAARSGAGAATAAE